MKREGKREEMKREGKEEREAGLYGKFIIISAAHLLRNHALISLITVSETYFSFAFPKHCLEMKRSFFRNILSNINWLANNGWFITR